MEKAKVFWSGRSQAVRLPKEFRFDTDEVTIRREGDEVILKPVAAPPDWLAELLAMGPVDDEFVATVLDRPKPEDVSDRDIFE
jgi:antitoxin VapB